MAFFVPEILYSSSHLSLMIILFYRWGNSSLEKLSNLLNYHNCKLLQLLKQQLNIKDEALSGNQVGWWWSDFLGNT